MVRIHHGPPAPRSRSPNRTQPAGRWFECITAHQLPAVGLRIGLNPLVDGSNPSRPTSSPQSVSESDSTRWSMVRTITAHHLAGLRARVLQASQVPPAFRRVVSPSRMGGVAAGIESITAHHLAGFRVRFLQASQVPPAFRRVVSPSRVSGVAAGIESITAHHLAGFRVRFLQASQVPPAFRRVVSPSRVGGVAAGIESITAHHLAGFRVRFLQASQAPPAFRRPVSPSRVNGVAVVFESITAHHQRNFVRAEVARSDRVSTRCAPTAPEWDTARFELIAAQHASAFCARLLRPVSSCVGLPPSVQRTAAELERSRPSIKRSVAAAGAQVARTRHE
jgi:hypothetical protein